MLTKEQIQYLFAFCRQHYVQYYEVQIELVDHLANAVEIEMKHDAKISFEKAIEKIHRSFGVMGFAPLVAEKQKMAEKQSHKLFWKLFATHFKWPKILTFFLLIAIFFTLISAEPIVAKLILGCISVVCGILYILNLRKLSRMAANSGKKFLILNASSFGSFILLPAYFVCYSRFFEELGLLSYTYNNIICISIFFSSCIVLILTTFQTLSSIKQMLSNNYPEVFSLAK